MKILEFLKSFVLPTKMARFRSISALISLLIFVLSTYLLSIPFGKALADAVIAQKDTYNFLALQEADAYMDDADKAVLQSIVGLGCAVNKDGLLECENLASPGNREFQIDYEKDGIKKYIHIFFDFYDAEKEETPAYDLQTAFSIENEKYKYVENEEHYFVVFTRNYLYYQAHQLEMGNKDKGMEITHNQEKLTPFRLGLDYVNFMPDFNLKLANPNTFGDYVTDQYLLGFSVYYRSTAFIQTVLITLIFPLIMVLLFWLFFRKTGRLKRFKEYYNIAAISSIVPLLLSFGIAWIFPVILNWYIFIFSLFYLFTLFRINNMQTED
ncbi:MAG TPA: hypothetical protein VIK96_02625 [Bacilli bacterium]